MEIGNARLRKEGRFLSDTPLTRVRCDGSSKEEKMKPTNYLISHILVFF